MDSFLAAIQDRVLVCDGAMGTMLYAKGVFINRCFDALNLTQSDLVAEVHQAYVRAGADLIETNTFGANRIKLASFGQAERLHAINLRGVQIARHAARDRVFVAGAVGPLGIRIEPWGKTGVDEACEYFREQVTSLVEGGVDLFILETFRDLNEIGAAIAAVRSLSGLPIVAQMTTEEDGNSLDGTPPEKFAPELERLGAQVIGVNCSVGPAPMLETIDRISKVTAARLSAQPNAGAPRNVEGRYIYLSSPEYMASYARRFIAKGVRLVGGCCGTTPEHIRQIKQAVRSMTPAIARAPSTGPAVTVVEARTATAPPVPRPEKSRLAHAIARGHFVTAVELLPPRGHDVARTIEHARLLKIHGVDAINIPDSPQASTRMSALSMAVLVEQQAGVETVLHYTCRGRSLLAMQSDLLGAHAMGLRNVLIRTGTPPKLGDYPEVAPAFDVDSIGLTNVVARLNRGCDVGGQTIGAPTAFHIGVVANPCAENLDEEIRRFEYKVEAGAEFAITYPVFDVEALELFLKRIEPVRIPIIAAVLPFESLLNAEFLANEVPGIRVPEELVARLRRRESDEAQGAEGIAIAREIAAGIRDDVQGFAISTPADGVEAALAVLDVV
jgi:homocysteine S-methyltransferase